MAAKEFPAVMELFNQGYGPELVPALIESVTKYVVALGSQGDIATKEDADNIVMLNWLLRAILKDCTNLESL